MHVHIAKYQEEISLISHNQTGQHLLWTYGAKIQMLYFIVLLGRRQRDTGCMEELRTTEVFRCFHESYGTEMINSAFFSQQQIGCFNTTSQV